MHVWARFGEAGMVNLTTDPMAGLTRRQQQSGLDQLRHGLGRALEGYAEVEVDRGPHVAQILLHHRPIEDELAGIERRFSDRPDLAAAG